MKATCSLEIPHAFCVTEDDIKKLCRLFRDRIGTVEITVDCADNITRQFNDIKELFAFENPKSKAVRRLRFMAQSDDFSKRVGLDFRGTSWRGISLDISASDSVVSRLKGDSLDIISGMQPWYSRFQRINFISIAFLTACVFWFVLLVTAGMIPTFESAVARGSAFTKFIVCMGAPILLAFGFAINWVRDAIFPRSVFLIGQGKQRYKYLEKFQWSFIIAFVASLAASIIIATWQAV